MNSVLSWLLDHPGLIVPIATGLLSFGLGWVEKRFPTFAAIFRASGLDAAGLVKILLGMLRGKK